MNGSEEAARRQPPPGGSWLDQHWTELPNNTWVAATDNEIVAQNESFDQLIVLLADMRIPVADVSFAFATVGLWQ